MSGVDVTEVAEGVFFAATPVVNWVVLVEDARVALIDAGYPKQLDLVLESIRKAGARPEQLDALVLTHAHVDHAGGAPELVRRFSVDVYSGAKELPMLRGERLESAGVRDVLLRAWRPRVMSWGLRIAALGGSAHPTLDSVHTVVDGRHLDIPRSPVPLTLGGHTSGHTAYLLPSCGVLVLGDALATGHPLSRRQGPQLLEDFFHTDPELTRRSLRLLDEVDAEVLLPGHGPLLRRPPYRAAREALAVEGRG